MATTRNEAHARAVIDELLKAVGWNLTDGQSVRYEMPLADGTRADYVLCDRHGRSLAVIEAKRSAINPAEAADQGRAYAESLGVPFVFLANGQEIRFWDWQREAHPHPVRSFFSQGDLERRVATRQLRIDPLTVEIDRRIVERDYQWDCINVLCREINSGRRKLLVEMATGTGKTRTAAALIKRLFDANAVTRVLFLVDRIPLALQTEDAFAEHLRDLPCYVLRSGRRFQDEKRITIATLQSMINVYHEYSAGYFDLVITDECHRSIYGKWRRVLEHFDGIQIGLTATPSISDEVSSGDEEDKAAVRDTLRFFEVDQPTFSYQLRQAISDGYLVPYQIYKAKTVKTAADGGFEVTRDDLDWTSMDAATRTEFEKLFQASATITVDPTALERRFTIPERNRAMVREFQQVITDGYQDPAGRRRTPIPGKTIVFAVTKRHAETLARMFDEAFAHQKPSPEVRFADYVVSGTGTDDTVDGIAKIRRFKREPFPQILVSVNMLDTGFDCPEVMNLVFARFTKSVILYRQMRGRGTRKARNKPVFTMFDFVGVTDYHSDDENLPTAGKLREQPPTSPPGTPRALVTLNVDDQIDPMTRAWVTVDENGTLVFAPPAEARASDLGARFEEWLGEQSELTPQQERFLALVGSQIRANADQWHAFTPDHLAIGPLANQGGRRRAIELFEGEASVERLFISLNAAVFGSDTRLQ